ncbi:hypothetical protein ABID16_001513 [Rhizobium aquaticum]|uniref:Porin n=1 Tax=Rhizobium aquaticum TaxID=1549636 RepID=A0ABV2IXQ3_9HYPH
MNIKSVLLGSSTAFAVVSGAQASDAMIAAAPEPMEYVNVCDAFGTGYFIFPAPKHACVSAVSFAGRSVAAITR